MLRVQLVVLAGVCTSLGAQGQPTTACGADLPYAECALVVAGIPQLRDMRLSPGEREVRFWVAPDRGSNTKLLRLVQRGDSVTASLALLSPGSARSTGALPPSQDWAAVLGQLDLGGLASTQTVPARGVTCDAAPLPPLVPGGLPRDRICRLMVHPTTYVLEVRTSEGYWRYQLLYDSDPSDPNTQRDARLLRTLTCALARHVTEPCPGAGAP